MKYKCNICGFIYDDDKETINFKDLPQDWTCPVCGTDKDEFSEITK